MEEKRRPRLYWGLIVLAVVIALMVFVCAPLQMRYGLVGLVLTELLILAGAMIPALLLRYDVGSMFRVKKPTLRQVIGVLFLWNGALLVGYFFTYFSLYLFPEGMGTVAGALNDFVTSANPFLAFLAVALLPAVCEEALFRGFILHTFGGISRKWLVILLTGALFGAFHLDFYRFLPTMVLGLALTYIMVETGNLLLPILFHFVNNAWSTSLAFWTKGMADSTQGSLTAGIPLATVGSMLLVCSVSPWLILAGSRLIKPRDQSAEPRKRRGKLWVAAGVSALCLVVGVAIIGSFASTLTQLGEKVLDMSFTAEVNKDVQPVSFPFKMEKAGYCNLEYSVGDAGGREGRTRILLAGSDGSTVFEVAGGGLYGNSPLQLPADDYVLTFDYEYDFEETETVDIRFAVTRMY